MARIVFGSPAFATFHLLDRLQRQFARSGSSVTSLLTSHAQARFWRLNGLDAALLEPTAFEPMRAPLAAFAATECDRVVGPTTSARRRRRETATVHRLGRLLPALVHWFERSRPDLVVFDGSRTAEQRLVHFVAREFGTRTAWIGPGLLPHTLQHDPRGVDGESGAAPRSAGELRDAAADPGLLSACLAHLLSRTMPAALARRACAPPPLRSRLADALRALAHGNAVELRLALHGWRDALPSRDSTALDHRLPDAPFVTVLLQDEDDVRVRLDAQSPPAADLLVRQATAAARAFGRGTRIAVVLPPKGLRRCHLGALQRPEGVVALPSAAAAEAAALGVATLTINHPAAVAALLAGSPVLHCGRALYGLAGVTWERPLAEFPAAFDAALRASNTTLRERLLTRLLVQHHVWCSMTHPDWNGILGLTAALSVPPASTAAAPHAYRAGPPWPLASPLTR